MVECTKADLCNFPKDSSPSRPEMVLHFLVAALHLSIEDCAIPV